MKRKQAAVHQTLNIAEPKAMLLCEFAAAFESYFFASGAEEGVHPSMVSNHREEYQIFHCLPAIY